MTGGGEYSPQHRISENIFGSRLHKPGHSRLMMMRASRRSSKSVMKTNTSTNRPTALWLGDLHLDRTSQRQRDMLFARISKIESSCVVVSGDISCSRIDAGMLGGRILRSNYEDREGCGAQADRNLGGWRLEMGHADEPSPRNRISRHLCRAVFASHGFLPFPPLCHGQSPRAASAIFVNRPAAGALATFYDGAGKPPPGHTA